MVSPQTGASTDDLAEVRSLVRQHDMRFVTGREQAVVGGHLRTIGLQLEVSGVYNHVDHPVLPGSEECQPLIAALERVVAEVIPKEHRRSRYEVNVPHAGLGYTSGGQPEITATVGILHGDKINDPVDACEVRCLNEMVSKLRRLGAKEGRH